MSMTFVLMSSLLPASAGSLLLRHGGRSSGSLHVLLQVVEFPKIKDPSEAVEGSLGVMEDQRERLWVTQDGR